MDGNGLNEVSSQVKKIRRKWKRAARSGPIQKGVTGVSSPIQKVWTAQQRAKNKSRVGSVSPKKLFYSSGVAKPAEDLICWISSLLVEFQATKSKLKVAAGHHAV
ncbi:hypothetical protein ACOSP7_010336 [Xanthoceras sorbifolium]